MGELRPIGTEFWTEPVGPCPLTSTCQQSRFLVRVVEHSDTLPFGEGGPVVKMETVQPLRGQTRRARSAVYDLVTADTKYEWDEWQEMA